MRASLCLATRMSLLSAGDARALLQPCPTPDSVRSKAAPASASESGSYTVVQSFDGAETRVARFEVPARVNR